RHTRWSVTGVQTCALPIYDLVRFGNLAASAGQGDASGADLSSNHDSCRASLSPGMKFVVGLPYTPIWSQSASIPFANDFAAATRRRKRDPMTLGGFGRLNASTALVAG